MGASVIEADASRFRRIEGSEVDWTEKQLRRQAIKEFINALDGEASPLNPHQAPKALSPSDPAAAWTTRGRHKVMFGYAGLMRYRLVRPNYMTPQDAVLGTMQQQVFDELLRRSRRERKDKMVDLATSLIEWSEERCTDRTILQWDAEDE